MTNDNDKPHVDKTLPLRREIHPHDYPGGMGAPLDGPISIAAPPLVTYAAKQLAAFVLPLPDVTLPIPEGAEFLTCRVHQGQPTLFMLVPIGAPMEQHRFIIVPAHGTILDGKISGGHYVGTLGRGNADCLHVFHVPILGQPILRA